MITPRDLGLPEKFDTFWPWQEKAILDLASSPCRATVFSAPTGVGKSPICLSTALLRGDRVLYLTPTKALESQLYGDFSSIGLYDIRGHTNYPCASTSYDDNGDLADLQCSARLRNTECDYYLAVEAARKSQLVLSNPAHWIALQRAGDPDRLGTFDLLILDEGHNMHDVLISCLAIKLYEPTLRALLHITDNPQISALPKTDAPLSEWVSWSTVLLTLCRRQWKSLSKQDERHPHLSRLARLGSDLKRFLSDTDRALPWIIEDMPFRGQSRRGAVLSPVWGKHYAEEYLFRNIPRVILTSATITEDTARYLGLQRSDGEGILDIHEVSSQFDPRRRPLIYLPSIPPIRVDHRITEGEVRIWVRHIDNIIEARDDRKGIVHALSYRRARDIYQRSRHRQDEDGGSSILLTHGIGGTRDCVERFLASDPPAVLLSPAVEEGFDFPGDTCRFQIIPKVPFIDTRSPLIQARLKDDKTYGDYLTGQRIVQMVGRGVRSRSDACECFIVDSHWEWFQRKVKFARWFKKAFRWESKIPPAPKF